MKNSIQETAPSKSAAFTEYTDLAKIQKEINPLHFYEVKFHSVTLDIFSSKNPALRYFQEKFMKMHCRNSKKLYRVFECKNGLKADITNSIFHN